jgi:hypothetical protein
MSEFHRWYEKYPHIEQILQRGLTLSEDNQNELAHRLTGILNQYQAVFDEIQLLQNIEEDRDIFSHLKLGMQKHRWYDRIQELHQDIDLLLFLPDKFLMEIDDQCKLLIADFLSYE